jgi:DNA-directed RNA polymerase subunit RPC12/RpoP
MTPAERMPASVADETAPSEPASSHDVALVRAEIPAAIGDCLGALFEQLLEGDRTYRCLRCTQTYQDDAPTDLAWCPYCDRVTVRELVA